MERRGSSATLGPAGSDAGDFPKIRCGDGAGKHERVVRQGLSPDANRRPSAVPKTENAWKVPYDDGKGGTIDEYVTYSNDKDDFALIFVTVVDRPPHYVFSTTLLARAMELNGM